MRSIDAWPQNAAEANAPPPSTNRPPAAPQRLEADEEYEQNVFCAKVYASIRRVESEADFTHFQVYRLRVFEGRPGKDVAEAMGVSEPTVSRHLQRIRDLLRRRLSETVTLYSFTDEERREGERAGLGTNDELFDDAIGDIYHRQAKLIDTDRL